MKKLNKFFAVFCAAIAAVVCAGCGGGISKATLTYPDYPNADPTKDSWTQWEEEDKVTINWYVDLAGWSNNSSSLISKEIYRRTGVNIVFETPANADGSNVNMTIMEKTAADSAHNLSAAVL